jgi:hypothetical protein
VHEKKHQILIAIANENGRTYLLVRSVISSSAAASLTDSAELVDESSLMIFF